MKTILKRFTNLLVVIGVACGALITQPATVTAAAPKNLRITYTNGLDGHVISINPDGSDRRDYGPGYFPKSSPDGTKIAFSRDGQDSTTRDLYVANMDGSNLRKISERVYTEGSMAMHFSWSPDSKKLVFTKEYGATSPDTGSKFKQLAVAHVDGLGVKRLTHEKQGISNINPMWSPDGSRILYTRISDSTDLYSINAYGFGKRLVASNSTDGKWSPDSSKIVFSEIGVGVRTANADGSNRATLDPYGASAKWSPDSSRIVMAGSWCDGCGSNSPAGIITIKPDGTDKIVLAQPPTAGGVGQPAWSPDGTKVIFTEFARWQPSRLVAIDATGQNPTVIVTEPAGSPEWAY